MTFEERLAALGVDLSDLPTHYSLDMEVVALEAAADSGFGWLEDYVCHLTDIIDRMETRIVNLTGELDWLIRRAPDVEIECDLCVHRDHVGEPPCDKCAPPPGESFFEFAGIPEEGSVNYETD